MTHANVIIDPHIIVDEAAALGEDQMHNFERRWPGSFHQPLPKIVHTMAISFQHIKPSYGKVFDTETIYARTMELQSNSRSIDLDEMN